MKIEPLPFDYERFEAELSIHLPCRHVRAFIGRKFKTNGQAFFRLQCIDCGRPMSGQLRFLKVRELTAEGLKLDGWDYAKEKNYWEEYYKHSTPIVNAINEDRRDRWWAAYEGYLTSPEWANRVRQVMHRSHGRCEKCIINKAVHVHHVSYDRVGEEELSDLQALCFDCHDEAHSGKLLIARLLSEIAANDI